MPSFLLGLGAASAYMITWPSTKITNLGALKMVLGGGRFGLYLLFVISSTLTIGAGVNLFI